MWPFSATRNGRFRPLLWLNMFNHKSGCFRPLLPLFRFNGKSGRKRPLLWLSMFNHKSGRKRPVLWSKHLNHKKWPFSAIFHLNHPKSWKWPKTGLKSVRIFAWKLTYMILELRKCWKLCFEGAEGLKTWFWRCGRAKNMVLEVLLLPPFSLFFQFKWPKRATVGFKTYQRK